MVEGVPRDDKVMSKKIDGEIKKFSILSKSFTKISESETDLSKKRTQAFEEIGKIEEIDNKCN